MTGDGAGSGTPWAAASISAPTSATPAVRSSPPSSPRLLYAWESIGQDFTWQQVTSGPAVIRLATWQYFAVKTVRVAGVPVLTLA